MRLSKQVLKTRLNHSQPCSAWSAADPTCVRPEIPSSTEESLQPICTRYKYQPRILDTGKTMKARKTPAEDLYSWTSCAYSQHVPPNCHCSSNLSSNEDCSTKIGEFNPFNQFTLNYGRCHWTMISGGICSQIICSLMPNLGLSGTTLFFTAMWTKEWNSRDKDSHRC